MYAKEKVAKQCRHHQSAKRQHLAHYIYLCHNINLVRKRNVQDDSIHNKINITKLKTINGQSSAHSHTMAFRSRVGFRLCATRLQLTTDLRPRDNDKIEPSCRQRWAHPHRCWWKGFLQYANNTKNPIVF